MPCLTAKTLIIYAIKYERFNQDKKKSCSAEVVKTVLFTALGSH